jgi:hypothetical protein
MSLLVVCVLDLGDSTNREREMVDKGQAEAVSEITSLVAVH